MDQNGTVFAKAPQFSGDAYLKYYGKIHVDDPVGVEYMGSQDFVQISEFVRSLDMLSLHPQYLVAQDNNEYALVVGRGTKIYFDTHDSLSKTVDNLDVLLKSPVFATSSRDALPIDYLDLRFGNKLFYKLKQ